MLDRMWSIKIRIKKISFFWDGKRDRRLWVKFECFDGRTGSCTMDEVAQCWEHRWPVFLAELGKAICHAPRGTAEALCDAVRGYIIQYIEERAVRMRPDILDENKN